MTRQSRSKAAQRGTWSAAARIKGVERPASQQQPQRAAGDGQQDVFDEQLPEQSRTTGADGEADAHLAPAIERARQHDAGDVGAGHQQQDPDGSAQRQGDGVEVARQLGPHVADERADDAVLVLRVPDGLMRPSQVLVGVGDGDTGLEPADAGPRVALDTSAPDRRASGTQTLARNPKSARAATTPTIVRGALSSRSVRPMTAGSAPKRSRHKRFADHHRRRAVRSVFVRRERAADQRGHSQHVEEVPRDLRALHALDRRGRRPG